MSFKLLGEILDTPLELGKGLLNRLRPEQAVVHPFRQFSAQNPRLVKAGPSFGGLLACEARKAET
jgi:hypothetical protein